jgi:hypothetical protein
MDDLEKKEREREITTRNCDDHHRHFRGSEQNWRDQWVARGSDKKEQKKYMPRGLI